jgi:hypothetical protein
MVKRLPTKQAPKGFCCKAWWEHDTSPDGLDWCLWQVYISSNTYVTFGRGSGQYSGLGANGPAIPGVHIAGSDNSAQRIG